MNEREKLDAGECTKADLCYSLQETVFAMLVCDTFLDVWVSNESCGRLRSQRGRWHTVNNLWS